MSTWHERKEERRREFARNFGLKMETCAACSGSGYYDNNGSPRCGSCGGTGKQRQYRAEPVGTTVPLKRVGGR